MCSAHYQRVRRTGDPQADVPIRARNQRPAICRIEGCTNPTREQGQGKRGGDRAQNRGSHGLCVNHSKQFYARRKRQKPTKIEYVFAEVAG